MSVCLGSLLRGSLLLRNGSLLREHQKMRRPDPLNTDGRPSVLLPMKLSEPFSSLIAQ